LRSTFDVFRGPVGPLSFPDFLTLPATFVSSDQPRSGIASISRQTYNKMRLRNVVV